VATGGVGTTIQQTKPLASPPPSSTVVERAPTTSYDVDLYEPKQGDTWETISREFYNDTRYAAALKAANLNKPLTSGGTVDVPPLYVLKQKFTTSSVRPGTPGGQVSPPPPAAPPAPPAPSWGPSTSSTPVGSSGGSQIYRVPSGVTSEREIAKNFLGSEQRWQEIYNLNPQITNPNNIPAGTEVRLPADARMPNN
jgi:nucleoid-associated protein YgaU